MFLQTSADHPAICRTLPRDQITLIGCRLTSLTLHQMIQTDALVRRFAVGDSIVHALDHVDLTVGEGEFVAIMGPSGSGKSTLMNILGCLDTPDDGDYRLLGESISERDDQELSKIRNRQIGFVFQSFHLLPRMTALENTLLPYRYRDDDVGDARDRAVQMLTQLGLQDRMDHRPNQLSGGQRQRVANSHAHDSEPPLIKATHEDEIAAYAGRVIHMRDGKVERDVQNSPH